MTKCENEPKAQSTDKVKTSVDETMSQFAGKTSEAIWLACAIEAEGSIQLTWGKRSNGTIQLVPRINLANLSQEFIDCAYNIRPGKVNHQASGMMYLVWYGMLRVKSVLEFIYPCMVIERKKEIARTVLEFINYRLAQGKFNSMYGQVEKDLFLKVRELNGKGRVPKQELKFRFDVSSTTTRHAQQELVKI
jgi:hypothetical protein